MFLEFGQSQQVHVWAQVLGRDERFFEFSLLAFVLYISIVYSGVHVQGGVLRDAQPRGLSPLLASCFTRAAGPRDLRTSSSFSQMLGLLLAALLSSRGLRSASLPRRPLAPSPWRSKGLLSEFSEADTVQWGGAARSGGFLVHGLFLGRLHLFKPPQQRPRPRQL